MAFKNLLAAASTAVILAAGAASAGSVSNINAATVAGTFSANFMVTAVNVTNVTGSQSQATMANFNAALAGTLGDGNEVYSSDVFTYSGTLDFGTSASNSTTIGSFIGSGSGSESGLDATFAGLQNSKGSIGNGTATSTFYLFEIMGGGGYSAGAFNVAHDDGMLLKDVAGVVGPTSLRGTRIEGFAGGKPVFLYVSTNSDPSIFRVDGEVSSVPLPAAGWMLLAGLGALGAAKRRRKAA